MAALASNVTMIPHHHAFSSRLVTPTDSMDSNSDHFERESPNIDQNSCSSDDTVLSVGNETENQPPNLPEIEPSNTGSTLSFKNIENHLNALSQITNSTLRGENSDSVRVSSSPISLSSTNHRLSPSNSSSRSFGGECPSPPNSFLFRSEHSGFKSEHLGGFGFRSEQLSFRTAETSSSLCSPRSVRSDGAESPGSPGSRHQGSSPFYHHTQSSHQNSSSHPSSPQTGDQNNPQNEAAASTNHGSLKFSIDNILKADFGRSKILDPITIRKSKPPPCRRTSTEKLNSLAALHVGDRLSSFPGEHRLQEKAQNLATSPGSVNSDRSSNAEGDKGPVDLSPKGDGSSESKGKEGQPILWPAWVYCTRYSDRPSSGKAGIKWLQSFLRRRPDIAVRKAENTSIARVAGMSRETIHNYFTKLEQLLIQHSLHDKPGHIFNADETGLQLNTRAGEVLAQKGSKCVATVSPGEKGETITVLSCCNAEGMFLSPFCVFKGKNQKEEWKDGMPPGSRIVMSEKSAYVNSTIFFDWLQNHFYPRKPAGTCLLIVDGHTSHTTNVEMLEFAERSGIILFCLPPHTTHYLQPLDRAFFKSLKGYYYESCRNFMRSTPNRKLNRMQFGKLLGEAWGRAATAQNGISAFRSTGIAPFNEGVIPDYAFLAEETIHQTTVQQGEDNQQIIQCEPRNEVLNPISTLVKTVSSQPRDIEPHPGPSGTQCNKTTPLKRTTVKNVTPGKALDEISPVPVVHQAAKRARRQIIGVITTPEYINQRKEVELKKNATKTAKKRNSAKVQIRKVRVQSFESSDSSEILLNDSSSEEDRLSDYENECVGCKEDYRVTTRKDDWLQCVACHRWLHDGCTSFVNLCQECGSKITLKKKTNR